MRFVLLAALLTGCPHAVHGPRGSLPAIDSSFLRDVAETRNFTLGRPRRARPTPDGKSVAFLRSPPRSPEMHLFELDLATGKARTLLTPADVLRGAVESLSPEEKARRERMRESARGFTSYALSRDGARV